MLKLTIRRLQINYLISFCLADGNVSEFESIQFKAKIRYSSGRSLQKERDRKTKYGQIENVSNVECQNFYRKTK